MSDLDSIFYKILRKELKRIEKAIKGTRFTSVTQYLEDIIELHRNRIAELEQLERKGSLSERQNEIEHLKEMIRMNISLLLEHFKIKYGSGQNV